MPRRYPLQPLRSVRQQQVQDRAGELSEQVDRTRQAEQERLVAAQAALTDRACAEQARGEEAARLEDGRLRAGDLAQAVDFDRGAEQRAATLTRAERAADSRRAAEAEAEVQARQALAQARGAATAVDQHHDRWQRARERERERRQQAATEDAWVARDRSERR